MILAFLTSCFNNPYLIGAIALLMAILYAGADTILTLVCQPFVELARVWHYLRTRGLIGLWVDLCELGCRIGRAVATPLIAALSSTEPLPPSTNGPLALLGVLIWAFAISLNWLGDNRTYVVSSLVVIGLAGLTIFVKAGRPQLVTLS